MASRSLLRGRRTHKQRLCCLCTTRAQATSSASATRTGPTRLEHGGAAPVHGGLSHTPPTPRPDHSQTSHTPPTPRHSQTFHTPPTPTRTLSMAGWHCFRDHTCETTPALQGPRLCASGTAPVCFRDRACALQGPRLCASGTAPVCFRDRACVLQGPRLCASGTAPVCFRDRACALQGPRLCASGTAPLQGHTAALLQGPRHRVLQGPEAARHRVLLKQLKQRGFRRSFVCSCSSAPRAATPHGHTAEGARTQ
jgi:hypothetical protein